MSDRDLLVYAGGGILGAIIGNAISAGAVGSLLGAVLGAAALHMVAHEGFASEASEVSETVERHANVT
jgi:outer membrane lipoprotein SlyB